MELTASWASKPQGNNFANCPPYLCHQGLQSQMSPQNVKGGEISWWRDNYLRVTSEFTWWEGQKGICPGKKIGAEKVGCRLGDGSLLSGMWGWSLEKERHGERWRQQPWTEKESGQQTLCKTLPIGIVGGVPGVGVSRRVPMTQNPLL